jgi:hypothetical protein
MDGNEQQAQFVKRVVLPSGKTIEVIYFKSADTAPTHVPSTGREAPDADAGPSADVPGDDPESVPAAASLTEPAGDLHLCLDCDSDLVQPTEWEESGPQNWMVTLSCPSCGTTRNGVFGQETVERFDEELDRGADALARDYRLLVRANMAEEIERFVKALEADALLPMDF